ncbi:hypothetical protein LTR53_000332 [Teratosphaeriaceae sp. CCFEE 6253]|nr:hypothetical protein LTR53_000332 [Teratosphaeriaceae sp. CCFEE 6253]
MVEQQLEVQAAVNAKSCDCQDNNVLGAVTNDVAQLQVATMAMPDPHMVQACNVTSEAADRFDREMLERHRERANTANSSLAYVPPYVPPPRTPSRARSKKSMYPLGLYGDTSGQRYPPFRSNTIDTMAPPVYGDAYYRSQMPMRKPVPRNFSHKMGQSSSSPEEKLIDVDTSPVLATSDSQSYFTHSFPVSAKGNARSPFDDAASYADLADEAQNAIRPFSEPQVAHPVNSHPPALPPLRPGMRSAATSPAVVPGLPKSRSLANNLTFDRDRLNKIHTPPVPDIPVPDFIQPKPALKQRYVSAGGNAKVSERAEIAGPAFATQLTSNSSGAAIPKEQLFDLLSDPDFVRANFGEAAVGKMSTTPRPSAEATSPPPGQSARASVGSQQGSSASLAGKRERVDSGASGGSVGRFSGKLKRVFSRHHSVEE